MLTAASDFTNLLNNPRPFPYMLSSVLGGWQVFTCPSHGTLATETKDLWPWKLPRRYSHSHCFFILFFLTHISLWYLKKRPLMDHNLFIFIFKKKKRSAPSKKRSGCVCNKMKPPVWTIDTCSEAKQKRLAPVRLILTSSKSHRGWMWDSRACLVP